jgi:signal transduction histidine kinase
MLEPDQQRRSQASPRRRPQPAQGVAWLRARVASGWRRAVRDSLLALAAVALTTGVLAALQLHPRPASSALAYLLVIIALGSTRGYAAAIPTALLASFAYNLFLSRRHALVALPELNDLLDPLVFLATAALVGQLKVSVRRHSQQAQERAVRQERQRLARELHDSVCQDLYGISLGIHSAREALDTDPREARAPLEYALTLTEAGLAEMRALILERHPEALASEGLIGALSKQVTILRTHYKLTVEAQLGEEPELSLRDKQALYHIAQEALHNIVKHAQARRVLLRLSRQDSELLLEIGDDGKGFDPRGPFPGRLGLHSIQERVAWLGGTCSIESPLAQGTLLRVRIPPRHKSGPAGEADERD